MELPKRLPKTDEDTWIRQLSQIIGYAFWPLTGYSSDFRYLEGTVAVSDNSAWISRYMYPPIASWRRNTSQQELVYCLRSVCFAFSFLLLLASHGRAQPYWNLGFQDHRR